MKKIIAAGILVLAFSVSATAQNKKETVTKEKSEIVLMTPEVAAQKNITDLTSFVSMTSEMKAMLTSLFTTKYKMIAAEQTEQNKTYVANIITKKLEATLDAATYKKVRENETLFQSLIN